jgi:general secretion pathway protein N
MRLDRLGPKTWLLAAAAGWALCLWVLAMLGMGSRLGQADADAVAPQRLPAASTASAERLGPLPQYAEIGERPLFSENRRPQPFTIDGNGQETQANPFDYTLTSVLITPQAQVAILRQANNDAAQPVRVKMGEAVQPAPQWVLAALNPRSAVFRGPEGEKTLELRVFNGVGGAPATPVAFNNVPPPGQPQPGQPQLIQDAPPGQVAPGQPVPGVVAQNISQPLPQPTPPPQSAGDSPSTQAQLEAIRKRIEARRAQLRQQQQNPPPPPPGGAP